MNLLLPLLFLLASLGIINGFLLALFILSGNRRKVAGTYFAGLLLALCLRIGKSVYLHFFADVDRLVLQTGLSGGLLIGPFFYLTIRAKLRQEKQFEVKDLTLLGGLILAIGGIGYGYPYRDYPEYWNNYIIYGIYWVWLLFVVGGLYEGRPLLRDLGLAKKRSPQDKQLLGLMAGIVFITATYQFALYIDGFTYIWGALTYTFVFYVLLFQQLKSRYWKRSAVLPSQPSTQSTQWLKKVDRVMEEQRLFKNPKLKLEDLAQLTGLNKNQLSRLLNEAYPNGFAQYVNRWRVEEAKRLISQKPELSLEGIGYEAGFNSKSSFFATFKKLTQNTPAQYKKALQ